MRDLADRYFTDLARRPMWFTALIGVVCVIDLVVVFTGHQPTNVRVFNGTLAGVVLILMTIALIRRLRG